VVRPELSLTRVSGLETILGPRYIAVRPGPAEAPVARRFEGLEAPTVPDDPSTDALTLRLTAERRGSLAPGSPVLYRDIRVGDVREIRLAGDATHVEVRVSIEPRYAPLVRDDSRFWIQSGVGVDWGLFSGLSLRADSLDALLRPGVAFATPSRPGDRVGDDHAFALESEPDEDWLDWRPSIPLDATP
jgi:paraquat-inducible protein B